MASLPMILGLRLQPTSPTAMWEERRSRPPKALGLSLDRAGRGPLPSLTESDR